MDLVELDVTEKTLEIDSKSLIPRHLLAHKPKSANFWLDLSVKRLPESFEIYDFIIMFLISCR